MALKESCECYHDDDWDDTLLRRELLSLSVQMLLFVLTRGGVVILGRVSFVLLASRSSLC